MKIAFICGSLEPGRDGVGDYTRHLARACAARGHTVRLLAVADPFAFSPANPSSEDGLPLLRLTAADWLADTGRSARAWLDTFSPDWTSLQFVPYSFHPRGFFAPALPALFTTLEAAPRRQIFFHEIWIGSQQGAPLLHRLSGWWQRRATRRLVRRLRPAPVQTSTAYYRDELSRLALPASVLPLFGNIPPAPSESPAPAHLSGDLVCGLFGTLHPGWNATAFLNDFVQLAARLGRSPVLVSAGSLGIGEADFDRLARDWSGRIAFQKLGRQDAAALAAIFSRWDFAVTSMPWITLGKSGTVAALREHGLRVVVTAAGSPPRSGPVAHPEADADPGCIPYFRDPRLLAAAPQKTPARPGLAALADRFLTTLV